MARRETRTTPLPGSTAPPTGARSGGGVPLPTEGTDRGAPPSPAYTRRDELLDLVGCLIAAPLAYLILVGLFLL